MLFILRIHPLKPKPKRKVTKKEKVFIKKWAKKKDYERPEYTTTDYQAEIDESYYYDPEMRSLDEVFQ